ncbi:TlpA disulfide reductase family protein [Mucilaginibacter myungsuensis]|uniref:AhpC/TSA family protein n=1 Tax=Mucilaginibacter myungsuensis TaxID=649104 RepID=A0A929KX37_9SPHI|nr:TlpA disulfide reductase family protein [Mucilaginibacter myungsuensis]MBE9662053.1 AhpC/TSA family protein [Mucilaginibacter myungsuensis]MDN3599514.1 TlpA disulfide reductase family protein [Mucilaginibacter myungsuensis]
MKKLLLALITLTPFIGAAQDTFTIYGQVGKTDLAAKVYLAYRSAAGQMLDSANITGGLFTFKGPFTVPVNAKLILDHTGNTFNHARASAEKTGMEKKLDVLNLYLDDAIITVTGTDSIAKAKITGSPVNDDNQRLNTLLTVVNTRAKRLADDGATFTAEQQRSAEFAAVMQTRLKPIQTDRERIMQGFIKSNPKSYISLISLNSLTGLALDPAVLAPLYAGLSTDLKQTDLGKTVAESIERSKTTVVGSAAPDFSLNDGAGKPMALSSFRGRYVLVDLWASWCEPCRAQNPHLISIYNKYRTKKFAILGVSLDSVGQKGAWKLAIENDGLRWPQVTDLKGWRSEAAVLYNVQTLPQNVLIDPNGKIIARNIRGKDLEDKLAEIFGKI